MTAQLVIELFITIAIVCIQLIFFYSTFKKIREVTFFFPPNDFDESFIQHKEINGQDIQLLKDDDLSFSEDFISVISSINKYLLKNRGVTDFSIIKSIVERNIESRENLVSANISLPLYIGLMGTFTGIVLGLWNIAFSNGVSDNSINAFIGGVVIAMIGSFAGLLLTVINNSYSFKNAKAICDERKNIFYNFLQAELLPHLENSLYDALDRLKININDFNKKFETNIELFDSKFSGNIASLSYSVQLLSENIGAVVDNTKTQKQFLLEIQSSGYNNVVESNIKAFRILKAAVPTFLEFIDKQKELTLSIDHASRFVQTIESILNRIKIFEESINRLGENINSKQYLSGHIIERIDKNLSQLDNQFELLKRHEIQSSETIEEFFRNQYKKIQELTNNIRREVETALDLKIENNPLKKLLHLETMDNNLNSIKGKINSDGELKQLCNDLNFARIDIQEIKKTLLSAQEQNRSVSLRQEPIIKANITGEQINSKLKKKRNFINQLANILKWKRGKKG
jgi:biopolymer transport protein ExbB/TolQ